MARRLELSGNSLGLFLYAFQLAVLLLALLFVVPSLDSSASVLLTVLFVVFVTATSIGLWRRSEDGAGRNRPGTAEDITYDPFADPGQAVKDSWEKAIRRLPDGDDERD